jgi:acetyl esterase/lipase
MGTDMRNRYLPFLLALIILFSSSISAQENIERSSIVYKTENDIFYRNPDNPELTEYMKERCKLDLYYPTNEKDYATIVWFHAGGITQGSKFIPEPLKGKGHAVAAVNYRLSPKVKCPEYIEDAAASVAWVFKNIADYGGKPDLIFVVGHSAGGYLTSMVGLDKKWLADFDVDADKIAGLIPLSGHTITHFTVRAELGISGVQPVIDEYAPLYHVRSDAPPLVLITGDRNLEMLGRYEENAYLWRMMLVAGHRQTTIYELQGFDHGGMAWPAASIVLDTVERIVGSKKQEVKGE